VDARQGILAVGVERSRVVANPVAPHDLAHLLYEGGREHVTRLRWHLPRLPERR